MSELGNLLSQKAQNVPFLVQIREVENADIEHLFWRLFELYLHMQLCRDDMLVYDCLSLEVTVGEVRLIIIVPLLLLIIKRIFFQVFSIGCLSSGRAWLNVEAIVVIAATHSVEATRVKKVA